MRVTMILEFPASYCTDPEGLWLLPPCHGDRASLLAVFLWAASYAGMSDLVNIKR